MISEQGKAGLIQANVNLRAVMEKECQGFHDLLKICKAYHIINDAVKIATYQSYITDLRNCVNSLYEQTLLESRAEVFDSAKLKNMVCVLDEKEAVLMKAHKEVFAIYEPHQDRIKAEYATAVGDYREACLILGKPLAEAAASINMTLEQFLQY